MHWTEIFEKPPLLLIDKNRKPKTKLEKTRNRASHQNRKAAVFKRENRKPEPKIGQIRKIENPEDPSGWYQSHKP